MSQACRKGRDRVQGTKKQENRWQSFCARRIEMLASLDGSQLDNEGEGGDLVKMAEMARGGKEEARRVENAGSALVPHAHWLLPSRPRRLGRSP